MKFFTAAAVAALAAFATAYTNDDMPACAKPCIAKASKQVGCGEDDIPCHCDKLQDLTSKAADCVVSGCSDEDLIKTQQVSKDVCNSQ
ncbi:uncharacterized protein K452DRAFT_295410 [Aplosporella prunicola CBS 121167]|uniref:CFEM domain-containing protein n=1 Tax=Aplosporella prunicola CBS 121167 TaxID=1176127 RepID=A0A6A6BRJ1_9PEZI|nr:uncharacterized protein K452DRAFT_295410 [Aplosporella prunicola CBS 121167]KAF2145854.1 hypothetical protein K452DRAFT_295410 [Aplosporella prunicola CBS 121167]